MEVLIVQTSRDWDWYSIDVKSSQEIIDRKRCWDLCWENLLVNINQDSRPQSRHVLVKSLVKILVKNLVKMLVKILVKILVKMLSRCWSRFWSRCWSSFWSSFWSRSLKKMRRFKKCCEIYKNLERVIKSQQFIFLVSTGSKCATDVSIFVSTSLSTVETIIDVRIAVIIISRDNYSRFQNVDSLISFVETSKPR